MRSRNIKPGFFVNELLGTYDPIISLMFAGLWCLADRDGILEDRPLRIKAELFPYRDGTDVNRYLTVLERDGFVSRYSVNGVGYISINSFTKHQTPHHTERAKGYPKKPEENGGLPREQPLAPLCDGELTVPERSDSLIPDSLIPDSLIPDSLIPDSLIPDSLIPDSLIPDSLIPDSKDPRPPYQAMADLYGEVCGDVFGQRVAKLTDARKRAIAKAWRFDLDNPDQDLRTDSLDYWRRYFTACTRRGFFARAAAGDAKGEHAGWRPGFDFLIQEKTWIGMREGKYQ